MRLLAFCAVLLSFGCGSPPPAVCDSTFDDLHKWLPDPVDPRNTVTIDPTCPQNGLIQIGSPTDPAYLGRTYPYAVDTAVKLDGVFSLACDPADGHLVLGILEDGAKVDYQIGSLAAQTMHAEWIVKTGTISFLTGAIAAHPCAVSVRLRSIPSP